MKAVADRLPRLEKREPIFQLSFTRSYVVSVRRGFLLVLGKGCVFLLWHSLGLSYNFVSFLDYTPTGGDDAFGNQVLSHDRKNICRGS